MNKSNSKYPRKVIVKAGRASKDHVQALINKANKVYNHQQLNLN